MSVADQSHTHSQMTLVTAMLESMFTSKGAKILPASAYARGFSHVSHVSHNSHNSNETHAACFERIRASLAADQVVIFRCTREFMTAFDEYDDWLACGAFVITPKRVFVVGLNDIDAAVESLRVHYTRSADDLAGCAICDAPNRDVECTRCWNGVCKRCFARTHVNARTNADSWVCPFCRDTTDTYSAVQDIRFEVRATGKRALPAIRDTMRSLACDETQLCVSGHLPDGVWPGHHERTLAVKLRTIPGHTTRGGRHRRSRKLVWLETSNTALISQLLRTPGTVFLVGEIPHVCDNPDCEKLHGDLDAGRAYLVGPKGEVLEMVDMFGPRSAVVRALAAE
jgi:hypothetical protein